MWKFLFSKPERLYPDKPDILWFINIRAFKRLVDKRYGRSHTENRVAGIAFVNQPSFGRLPKGERLEKIKRSPQYRDGAFQNHRLTFCRKRKNMPGHPDTYQDQQDFHPKIFNKAIGIFVPLLPTTPFWLLTCWFYIRSSEKLYNRAMDNRYFGPYIRNYLVDKAIPLRSKIISVAVMWLSAILTIDITLCIRTDSAGCQVMRSRTLFRLIHFQRHESYTMP